MHNTSLICFVDKQYPPNHSFVAGMLSEVLPRKSGLHVQIVLASPTEKPLRARRFHRSICLPILPSYPRKAWRRVRAIAQAYCVGRRLIERAQARRHKVVLFVRNDPLMLVVTGVLRPLVDRLVFQSSFPFEKIHQNAVKRWAHRTFYRLASGRVDSVLAVSPLALKRVKDLAPSAAYFEWIPLLTDLDSAEFDASTRMVDGRVRFLYAGTHKAIRRLDVVLKGIVEAVKQGVDAEFVFLGATSEEMERFGQLPGVKALQEKGILVFAPPIPRAEMSITMSKFDVGLSVIPPSDIYIESAPTKLAEYMGAGLAVLASSGIDWQERMVRKSGAGELVDFQDASIAEGIRKLCEDREVLSKKQAFALEFAGRELRYEAFLPAMLRLLT
jgi:glycosyltransferase involved in cell wall biosynthesis